MGNKIKDKMPHFDKGDDENLLAKPVKTIEKKLFSFPSRAQSKQIFKVLNKKEKRAFIIFLILAVSSSAFLIYNYYIENTEIIPNFGGTYTEAMIGQPEFINPAYLTSNDVDRDLIEILFSGLMKYNAQGEIVPDLADNPQIKDEGRVYEFILKDDVFWSDGEEVTADDIVFTIETIQNPNYKSNERVNWLGVEIEKISNKAVRFRLQKPYAGFLERLTFKVMPAHIWQDISSKNFARSSYNLNPVTCGPYKFKNLSEKRDETIDYIVLEADPKYFGKKPYISEIIFYFTKTQEEQIKMAKDKNILGLNLSSLQNYEQINKYYYDHKFLLPRYFAIFFNSEKAEILKEKNVRIALNYGTDKNEIIEKVFAGKAAIVDSPILPETYGEIYGYNPPANIYEYDSEKAKQFLGEAGFEENENGLREKNIKKQASFQFKSRLDVGSQNKEVTELQKCLAKDSEIYADGTISGYFGNKTKEAVIKFQEKYRTDILDPNNIEKGTGVVGKSTREKLQEICFDAPAEVLELKFTLVTKEDSTFKKIAEILKEQWKKIGVELEIQTYSISDLESDFIKTRDYEMILIGEMLGAIPDPYPFWHSLQKRDPGLNLSLYQNTKVDKLLEEARETLDEDIRKEKYEEFQEILIADAPVIFLYIPDYTYLVSLKVKGIEPGFIASPSNRFAEIENWYIKTKRK